MSPSPMPQFGISPETALDDALLIHQIQIQGQQAYQEYETRGDLEALETTIQCERLTMDMTEDDRLEDEVVESAGDCLDLETERYLALWRLD